MVLMTGPRAASTGKSLESRVTRRTVTLIAKIRQTDILLFILKWLVALAYSVRFLHLQVDSDFKRVRLRYSVPGLHLGSAIEPPSAYQEHLSGQRRSASARSR